MDKASAKRMIRRRINARLASIALLAALLAITSVATTQDFDNDGIPDNLDNCIVNPNGPLIPDAGGNSQLDTNNDGYGNVCDPDLNNDNVVDFGDLPLLQAALFSQTGDANFNADADLNGDDVIDFGDIQIVQTQFFDTPGPAAPLMPANPRPNIIVFLVDDMGWGDSRVYNLDSKIPMPNLERLAAEGIKFTNAHSTPKCAPTRYSLLTGNYHWRGRYSYGAWDYRGGSQILDDQWSIAKILRDRGYDTAFIGKGHLGGDFYKKNSEEFAPKRHSELDIDFSRGFQNGPLSYDFNYSYVSLRGNFTSPYAYFESGQLDGDVNDLLIWPAGSHGNSRIFYGGIGLPDWDSTQVGPILIQQAISFIDGHIAENTTNNSNNPFFMYFAPTAAHGPYTPPEFFLGEPVKGVTNIGKRTDMIYEIDVALGFLLRVLEERALIENTLVFFVSDNGSPDDSVDLEIAAGHDATGGLRGFKGEIWENGHRIPFIMKWGDGTDAGSVIPPGTSSDQLVSVHDLMATLAALTGSSLPYDQGRDSFNLVPIITGVQPEDQPVRVYLIQEAREVNEQAVPPRFAILEGFWKLILNENDEVTELYNLADDLAESVNLSGDPNQAERVEDMRNALLQLRDSDRTSPMLFGFGP